MKRKRKDIGVLEELDILDGKLFDKITTAYEIWTIRTESIHPNLSDFLMAVTVTVHIKNGENRSKIFRSQPRSDHQ